MQKFENEKLAFKDEIFLNDQTTLDKKMSLDIYYKQRQMANENKYMTYIKEKFGEQLELQNIQNRTNREKLLKEGKLLEE